MSYLVGQNDARPWGTWEVLGVGEGYAIKRIIVRPGKRLSLQRHQYRGEHWVVVQGEAMVTIGDTERTICVGQNAVIAQRDIHRIANPGSDDLIFIEVQHGRQLEETDIERFEDDFGRIDCVPHAMSFNVMEE